MNILQSTTLPALADRDFILATDLDGTFLGGSEEDRLALYRRIDDLRDRIGLIFVSGRDPEFICSLCADTPVPWPEYAVGDVGTTIAKVSHQGNKGSLSPITALEEDIARRWGDSGGTVRAALDGHPGLKVQPTAFRYRVSYDMDPTAYDPRAEQVVTGMGLDWLISDNRYFDVLPNGVSKGPSLLRLLDHLGIAHGKVLVAGDTLNDLSMLTTGLNAVAVGGSEAPLLSALEGCETVYRAGAKGAGGIMEAMEHFGHVTGG